MRGNTDTIIRLYRLNSLAIVSEKNFQGSLLAESLSGSEDKANAITTLISLFPIDAYRILTYVEQNRIIDTSDILAIAVKKKIRPINYIKCGGIRHGKFCNPFDSFCGTSHIRSK